MLDTDIRFEPMSDMDALGRIAASGSAEYFAGSSAMLPEVNLGVSFSMAKSLLGRRSPCVHVSDNPPAVLWLYTEDVRDFAWGLDGGGIDSVGRLEFISVFSASAAVPLRLAELEVVRVWEVERCLLLGKEELADPDTEADSSGVAREGISTG
jgi:hypothetical protein